MPERNLPGMALIIHLHTAPKARAQVIGKQPAIRCGFSSPVGRHLFQLVILALPVNNLPALCAGLARVKGIYAAGMITAQFHGEGSPQGLRRFGRRQGLVHRTRPRHHRQRHQQCKPHRSNHPNSTYVPICGNRAANGSKASQADILDREGFMGVEQTVRASHRPAEGLACRV